VCPKVRKRWTHFVPEHDENSTKGPGGNKLMYASADLSRPNRCASYKHAVVHTALNSSTHVLVLKRGESKMHFNTRGTYVLLRFSFTFSVSLARRTDRGSTRVDCDHLILLYVRTCKKGEEDERHNRKHLFALYTFPSLFGVEKLSDNPRGGGTRSALPNI